MKKLVSKRDAVIGFIGILVLVAGMIQINVAASEDTTKETQNVKPIEKTEKSINIQSNISSNTGSILQDKGIVATADTEMAKAEEVEESVLQVEIEDDKIPTSSGATKAEVKIVGAVDTTVEENVQTEEKAADTTMTQIGKIKPMLP
ncbi:MAG: hypothetical protein E7262_06135 [Lachnospiraceae bacterium]|nr:hypothetical protein [Lachnospiraceae bacterium]